MKFTFTNKETYLAYRSEWKARYKQLSQTIRDQKFMRAELSRACNAVPKAEVEGSKEFLTRLNGIEAQLKKSPRYLYLKTLNNRKSVEQLKAETTAMLEELKEAKQKAQRQYLASKELVMA